MANLEVINKENLPTKGRYWKMSSLRGYGYVYLPTIAKKASQMVEDVCVNIVYCLKKSWIT